MRGEDAARNYSQYRNGNAFFSMELPQRGHFPGSFQAFTRCASDTGHRTLNCTHLNILTPANGNRFSTDSNVGGVSVSAFRNRER